MVAHIFLDEYTKVEDHMNARGSVRPEDDNENDVTLDMKLICLKKIIFNHTNIRGKNATKI